VRILILNWRDTRSPRAGGAETLTHEVARRLVSAGHDVTWFTSRPDELPAEEDLDGVRIVRRGSETTTRIHAPSFARAEGWDVIVEEINTLPYFSRLWARAPVVLFIQQLAREVWWYESPKALSPVGYVAEPWYLRAYRRIPVITISASTRDDLRALGLRGEISVVPMAVSTPVLEKLPPKTPVGKLISIGRLVPSKRMGHAIEATALLPPEASLILIGDGPERTRLERLAKRLGVAERVELAGRVSDQRKVALIGEADLLVACSVREGWGLTITEAARLGTPAVCYDVPGLRDSIVAQRTGVLTAPVPAALAAGIEGVLKDPELYEQYRRAAWSRAAATSWDVTAESFEQAVAAAVAANRR
jgi:glycosyltransferase involved in cell wall biosynthesis